ncbi:MAG: uroporphyrinogen decarboxylase family protein [Bacteroidales bacterium]|nr:uroporphyrinogen decarboxylase family protein [Bacteroidales bacterium]
MNSRERILAAINHKQPDRIPVDLGATPSSGEGYVFNSIHNIMPDVPPENIMAMFETVQEFH